MNNDFLGEIIDIMAFSFIFAGMVVFLIGYNNAINASHGQTIDIKDFNLILESDCDSRGGEYISFDKKQGCIIYYPYYTNIKY